MIRTIMDLSLTAIIFYINITLIVLLFVSLDMLAAYVVHKLLPLSFEMSAIICAICGLVAIIFFTYLEIKTFFNGAHEPQPLFFNKHKNKHKFIKK